MLKQLSIIFFVLLLLQNLAVAYALAFYAKNDGLLFKDLPAPVSSVWVSDFLLFYKVGKIAGSTDRFQPYDQTVQKKWTNELIKPRHTDNVLFAPFVPWLFPFMIPFTWLPLRQSLWVWLAVNFLLVVTGLVSLMRLQKVGSILPASLIVLATTASAPFFYALWHGQCIGIVLGLACLYICFFQSNRDYPAALCLALLAIKPQYALLLSAPALALRRWKLLLAGLSAELLLLLLAGLNMGWAPILRYPFLLNNPGNIYKYGGVVLPTEMISLRALFSLFLPPANALTLSIFVFFLLLVVMIMVWRKIDPCNEVSRNLAWALTIIVALLVSPHAYLYEDVLLASAACLSIPCLLGTKDPQTAWFRYPWLVCFISFPLTSWIFLLTDSADTLLSQWKFLSLNLLLACLAFAFILRTKTKPTDKDDTPIAQIPA